MSDVAHGQKKRRVCFVVIALLIFIVGVIFGMLFNRWYWKSLWKARRGEEVRIGSKEFSYINPLLECTLSDDYIGSNEAKPSKAALVDLIASFKKEGMVDSVSVYFRNLNDGPWVGIDERMKFAPASLLKVPVMMSMLRMNEKDPTYLSQQMPVDFSSNYQVRPVFEDGFALEKDKRYSLSELMKAMVIHSNNDAAYTLMKNSVSKERLDSIFSDLHIEIMNDGVEDYITVKDYSALFRVLYNASYLSKDSSEEALKILSESSFDKGLVAGLPQGIAVAHKFGERSNGKNMQLHDCGIIYSPKQPYLLCVMTRGKDYDQLASVIAKISKQTYEDVMMSVR